MPRFALMFIFLLMGICVFAKTSSSSWNTTASQRQDQECNIEKLGQIEAEKEQALTGEKIYQLKGYLFAVIFIFGVNQKAMNLAALHPELLPAHRQIIERPPKN